MVFSTSICGAKRKCLYSFQNVSAVNSTRWGDYINRWPPVPPVPQVQHNKSNDIIFAYSAHSTIFSLNVQFQSISIATTNSKQEYCGCMCVCVCAYRNASLFTASIAEFMERAYRRLVQIFSIEYILISKQIVATGWIGFKEQWIWTEPITYSLCAVVTDVRSGWHFPTQETILKCVARGNCKLNSGYQYCQAFAYAWSRELRRFMVVFEFLEFPLVFRGIHFC